MVTAITNFGRSGLYDWLIQRVSAVVMVLYTLFIVTFIAVTPEIDYPMWSALFDQLWVRVFSLVTLISVVAHAWIGLWAVLTDYLTERVMGTKATFFRILAQMLLGVVAMFYTVWGIEILWGF